MKSLCRIVGFLLDTYGKHLNSDRDMADEIMEYMSTRMDSVSTLNEEVEQLELFFTGSYQLSLAISYLGELMGDDEIPQLHFVIAAPTIIKMEIRSLHKNSKTRIGVMWSTFRMGVVVKTFVAIHVIVQMALASVVYYLSHARYKSRIVKQASILSKVFKENPLTVVINSDSDED